MNNWLKFLLKESESVELIIDPRDYSSINSQEFHELFQKYWRVNDFFRDRTLRDLFKLEIDPAFKSLPREEQLKSYEAYKRSPSANDDRLYKFISGYEHRNLLHELSRRSTVIMKISNNHSNYLFVDLMKTYFSSTTMTFDDFSDTMKSNYLGVWAEIYYTMYFKHPDKIPKILRTAHRSNSSTFLAKNIRALNRIIMQLNNARERKIKLKNQELLKHFEIGQEVGEGAFGVVSLINNSNRVIKIFKDGVSLAKDKKRMNKIMTQVYGGSASLEDMHYFDFGILGTDELGVKYYYAIMPKITPVQSTLWFRTSEDIYYPIFYSCKQIAQNFTGKKLSFDRFKEFILKSAENRYGDRDISWDSRYDDNENRIDMILDAAYRAYSIFGGTDLHSGNIGFLDSKPDKLFYFDM